MSRHVARWLPLAVLAASCGYRPLVAEVPGGGESLSVPVVENRTAQGALAGPITGALRRRLATDGIEVRDPASGAPRLLVTVLATNPAPGALERSGDRLLPVDAIWAIEAEARVVDADGELLAGPVRIRVDGRALAGGSALAEEALGARRRNELIDELCERIFDALLRP